jgi:hydroxymethylpyrimidine/phosphomethylpyrimidine kinase
MESLIVVAKNILAIAETDPDGDAGVRQDLNRI